jgi:hypothetical protein
VSLTGLQAFLPNLSAIPADPGFLRLTATTDSAQGMQFNVGTGPLTSPLTWSYPTSNPIRFRLYYDDIDLPNGVAEADLRVRGYNGSAWSNVVAQQDSSVSTGNAFTVVAPLGSPAMAIYMIAYASSLTAVASAPTATPMSFKNTRSFSPTHRNPLYRTARFFYSDSAAKNVEARILDSSGSLVRELSVGKGINLSDSVSDVNFGTIAYYFDWDGANDNGVLVKNGIYLVRWVVTKMDGSTDTQVKPVALIK